jgi:hypothetical protein
MTSEPDRSKITQKLFPVGTLKRVNSSIPEIIGDKYTFVPVVDSPAADKLREIMRRYTKR